MSADEMHEVFAEWNKGELDSYLIEITRDILAKKDDRRHAARGQDSRHRRPERHRQMDGHQFAGPRHPDHADGRSGLFALRLGVEGRAREGRAKLKGPRPALTSIAAESRKEKAVHRRHHERALRLEDRQLRAGLHAHARGGKEYGWNLNYGGIALMWRGGCIIRSRFLGKIKEAYDKNPKLTNLLLDDYFRGEIKRSQKGWRNIVATAAKRGIPVPAFSTALAFYDQYRSAVLPANLLAGAARLFRRAHLRARGQAARRILPHQLDRQGRHDRLQRLYRVGGRAEAAFRPDGPIS
jgi:6-phosphogluconate dehydrogenase